MVEKNDDLSSSRTIEQKIARAYKQLEACGSSLTEDPSIQALLTKLRNCIENTNQSMVTLGVVAECKNCEEKEGGSCCGAGIENKYDIVLLLINLLLGCAVENNEPVGNSCYFLGKNGCKLVAREVLCVNYICDKLQKKLTREELLSLQTCAGEELDTLFILHETLKKGLEAEP